MLYLLLAVTIIVLPNALHVSVDTGVPGLNFTNLLFLVVLMALMLNSRNSSEPPGARARLTAPLLSFFATLVAGYLIARPSPLSDTLTDFTRLKNALFYPLLYFVFRYCQQDLRRTRQLILLVLLVAPLTAIEAIYQGLQFGLGGYDAEQRASGPFGGLTMANRAGVFYAMFLPMIAAIAVFDKRKVVRIGAVVGCVLLATAVLFTYSRQSYLIVLLGLLILLVHRSIAATALAGILLVATVSYFPASVVERVQQTRQVGAAGTPEVDNSTLSRFEIWEGAWNMWLDHPAGVGLGRFPTYIGEYSNLAGVDAHNVFVLVGAELGPLGLLALLWLFWRMWRLSYVVKRSSAPGDTEAHVIALGFRITVFSVALSNVYGSPFFEGLVMASFWILCGLVERYAVLKGATAAALLPQPAGPLTSMARVADRFPLAARMMPGIGSTVRTTRS